MLFKKRDLILVTKTSFGKSLIVQILLCLVPQSIILIVLPLVALGSEQEEEIRSLGRPAYNQRLYYSGYKKSHGFKYQVVTTSDGIISHISGPWMGKYNDLIMMRDSGLNERLDNLSALSQDRCSCTRVTEVLRRC